MLAARFETIALIVFSLMSFYDDMTFTIPFKVRTRLEQIIRAVEIPARKFRSPLAQLLVPTSHLSFRPPIPTLPWPPTLIIHRFYLSSTHLTHGKLSVRSLISGKEAKERGSKTRLNTDTCVYRQSRSNKQLQLQPCQQHAADDDCERS